MTWHKCEVYSFFWSRCWKIVLTVFCVSLFYVAPFTVTLNQPRPKNIFHNNQAELECVITGQDETTVNEIKITWQINGKSVNDNIDETTKSVGGQHSKTSTMTPNMEWLTVNQVRCSASRDDMTPVIQDLTVHKGGMLMSDGEWLVEQ